MLRSLPDSRPASVLLALTLALSGCEALGLASEPSPPVAPSEIPIAVTETFWTEPNEHTPESSDTPLAFNMTFGVREGSETVIATGRYRLPPVIRARYGEDPRHAIFLVAINTDALRIHAAPIGPAPESPAGDVFADSADGAPLEGTFNVDIPVALGLPVLAAPYQFFLWIDEHITPRQSFIIPSNSTVREGREVLPITGAAILLEATEGEQPVPSVTSRTEEGSTVVRGVVARDRVAHSMVPFLLMAVERPANRYGYARTVMPLAESPRFTFEMNTRHLFFNHEPEGRVWVIGMMAEATSEPVAHRIPTPEELAAAEASQAEASQAEDTEPADD